MTAPKVPTPTEPGRVPAIEDYRTVMVQRAIFQGLASMGLPAFTIHSVVKYSGRALKDVKNTRIRTYGPIGVSRQPVSVRAGGRATDLELTMLIAGSCDRTVPSIYLRRACRKGGRMDVPPGF